MSGHRVIASGLLFPEGPVAMLDGSVLVVEMQRRSLTRVAPDGSTQVVAQLAGGPNGAAIGPDGRCYICNNGGFVFNQVGDTLVPGLTPADYVGGWVEAVDLITGQSEVLYRACGDIPLRGPNDLVFDRDGGMWFTDTGKVVGRQRDRGAVFYARTDGSFIKQVVFPLEGPNGVGLSPDDRTLYVSESWTGRIWAYDIVAPGEIARFAGRMPWQRGRMLIGLGGYSMLDSIAVERNGNICLGDIPSGGIAVVTPDGRLLERHPMPDAFTTNICFGGPDLRTAYITLSSTGKLVEMKWPRPGLPLHHLNHRPATRGAAAPQFAP